MFRFMKKKRGYMFKKPPYNKENDKFKDYIFSPHQWSAPIIESSEDIKKRISSFKLEGRKIWQMRMIGLSYFLTREWIESRAYAVLDRYGEEERQLRAQYHNIEPEITYGRCSAIDEPFWIQFEDRDVFKIDTPGESKFRMSMNCIPWSIGAGSSSPNVDANILFAPCIGKTIASVELQIYRTNKEPMFGDFLNEDHSEREFVSAITLWLEDGNGINIRSVVDYCEIAFINCDRELHMIPFRKLKRALFNWEDLHIDETNGFEPESTAFYFGRTGAEHTETPYMTLVPGDNGASLNISVSDFLLFSWSITCYTKEPFDEYGEYEFTYDQWNEILKLAQRLLSFQSFDALCDYLTGLHITNRFDENVFLDRLPLDGTDFWQKREPYRIQLKDMCDWSDLTMTEQDIMGIYGF